ncbi:DinB family protein [Actinomadura sp. NPDC047616]|uniref:DinB family protein n=1 Tax=Actinomadura sp. NPDC047616 TaxID=3155914 RepID=UPI0034106D72
MVTHVEPPAEPDVTLTDPRDLLTGYLDHYRDAVLRKLDGLSDEQLRTSRLPSGWTPLELLKHLAYVETRWLRCRFADEPVPDPWGDRSAADPGPGGRWHVAAEETFEGVRATFLDACAHSRRIVAGARLDDVASAGGRLGASGPAPSLIWILFHLLQEYARHAGHLDVVRELADGVVGE